MDIKGLESAWKLMERMLVSDFWSSSPLDHFESLRQVIVGQWQSEDLSIYMKRAVESFTSVFVAKVLRRNDRNMPFLKKIATSFYACHTQDPAASPPHLLFVIFCREAFDWFVQDSSTFHPLSEVFEEQARLATGDFDPKLSEIQVYLGLMLDKYQPEEMSEKLLKVFVNPHQPIWPGVIRGYHRVAKAFPEIEEHVVKSESFLDK